MVDNPSIWRWTRRLPAHSFDTAIVLFVALTGTGGLIWDSQLHELAASRGVVLVDTTAEVLALAQAIPLWWRRRHAVEVLAIVAAGAILSAILLGHNSSFGLLFALFAASAYGPRALRLPGRFLALAILLLGIGGIWVTALAARALAGYAGEATGLAAIYLIGDYARTRRFTRESLEAQRTVAARDAERQKLERNLHDGAQQELVALKVKLGLLDRMISSDPAAATRLVGELKNDADRGLQALRELSRGINPPLLVQSGLAEALSSQTQRAPIPIRVEINRLRRYPEEIEASVYFCCLEAIQNVVKHSGANAAVVAIHEKRGQLHFKVEDDGKGIDPDRAARGSGMRNMAERLRAFGGSVEVHSNPGQGTVIEGVLPLPA